MRHYLPTRALCSLLFILTLPLTMYATAWSPEVIIVDGEEWGLLAKPLNADSTLRARLEEFLPEDIGWSTGNLDGFIGHWEIIDDKLYLKKIVIAEEGRTVFDADTLKAVYGDYYTEHGIYAGWFTQEKLRMGRGEVLFCFNLAYNMYYEEELILSMESGKVTGRKRWHNRVHVEGMELDPEAWQHRFKQEFPVDSFPELKERPVVLLIHKFKLHPDGHFDDCHICLLRYDEEEPIEDQSHPVIEAAKRTLHNIYPWKVYCIYGEFTPKPIVTFSMLLGGKPKQDNK